MKRFLPYVLLITGIWLSVTAVLVTAQDTPSVDVPEPSEYIGSRDCRDCHGDISRAHRETVHALTMVEVEEDEDENPVVADFSTGEDVRTVAFPDDAERPFTLEDVAYTLGAGRNIQAYIYEAEDEVYYILPAEWDVASGTWKRLELAETWPDEAYEFGKNCAGCHTVGLDVEDYDWEETGVQCEACHGPGLDHVEYADDAGGTIDDEERAEIYGAINLALDGQVCGQCHVRGLAEDGIHPYPVGYYPGLVELSDVFNLVDPADDEHWWVSGHAKLPNMQYNEWLKSGHPDAFTAAQESEGFKAECLTCHSVAQTLIDLRLNNEEIDPETVDSLELANMLSAGVTCASCHNPHLTSEDDEEVSLPALLSQESYALCTSCHSDNEITEGIHHPVREVFEGVQLVENIDVAPSPHFSAEDGPTCTTCHMPVIPTYNGERSSHTFEIVSPGVAVDLATLQDTCTTCHEQSPEELQQLIDDLQSGTRERIAQARETLDSSDVEWVTLALDVVENEGSFGIHNYAYTSALLNNVELELGLVESGELTTTDVSERINAVLPDVEVDVVAVDDAEREVVAGLTAPSIVLLGIVGLILIVSAFAFFRNDRT